MLIKSYGHSADTIGSCVHLIENATNITYESGYFIYSDSHQIGPSGSYIGVFHIHVKDNEACRIIDYDNEHGVRCRIYTAFAYICNDNGKTVEKLNAESVPPIPFERRMGLDVRGSGEVG